MHACKASSKGVSAIDRTLDTDECNHMVRWLQSWPSIAWAFAQILYNTGPYYFCIFLDSDTPPKCASWKRQRGMRNCRTRIRGLSCPRHHGSAVVFRSWRQSDNAKREMCMSLFGHRHSRRGTLNVCLLLAVITRWREIYERRRDR